MNNYSLSIYYCATHERHEIALLEDGNIVTIDEDQVIIYAHNKQELDDLMNNIITNGYEYLIEMFK